MIQTEQKVIHGAGSEYLPVISKIETVEVLSEKEKLFKIILPDNQELGHQPGQFVQVFIPGIGEAPISICSSPTRKGYFDLCVRKLGDVTNAMHNLKAGDTVGIRGPFGRGFEPEHYYNSDLVFIAGGIGLAPLRSVIQFALDKKDKFGKITIVYGAKNPSEQIFKDELKEWAKIKDLNLIVTVDRGDEQWKGNTGLITQHFDKLEIDPSKAYVLVCGPPIMYKFVILGLNKFKIDASRIILSLERRMRCGLGKCGHCQINSKYVCKDGPKFTYAEIKNLEEAI